MCVFHVRIKNNVYKNNAKKLCYSTISGTHKTKEAGESLNFSNSVSAQCLKVPGTTTFQKQFPKLDYKTSVTDNNKMKNSLPPKISYINILQWLHKA